MAYNIQRLASFTNAHTGGNPAGVVLASTLPSPLDMQAIAADLGYSETVFACKAGHEWKVRYYSPESEVPFCGHATIALGAALAKEMGAKETENKTFNLSLSHSNITVEANQDGALFKAALQSPPTLTKAAPDGLVMETLRLFGYTQADLDPNLPPLWAEAGATHLIIGLKLRELLAKMTYDLDAGRALMNIFGLVTIAFIYCETPTLFHVRNAFASGGVLEDPATGAAAAAFAGYLRDIAWPHGGAIKIIQGEDMGLKSLIDVTLTDIVGSAITVAGTVRSIS